MRTITNVGNPLTRPDGSPVEDAKITFRLVGLDGLPLLNAWAASGERVLSEPVAVFTNVLGEFSISLLPNDTITPASLYMCSISGRDDMFMSSLESGLNPKDWVEFFSQRIN